MFAFFLQKVKAADFQMQVSEIRVIPLFHTGHESPELPRIDFLLIRGGGGGFVRFH